MGTRSLKQEFLDHFGIASFFKPEKKGGQKAVYFPVIKGEKKVMKILEGTRDARFEREMKIYDKYKGTDGIPLIYSIDDYDGDTVVFEQYIEGETLDDVVKYYAGDGQKVKGLLQNLFNILTPIWKDKYVHRDIKPANIIIRPDGRPVILDFGIARDLGDSSITATGGLQPGTWKWAAPEQYAGEKDMISYRTDFFSIGVVMYFLYRQQLPFGNTISDIDARFKSGDESFTIETECPIKEFLTEAMRFKASYRPKDIEDLAKFIV
jgi:serine/threonine protein kinase